MVNTIENTNEVASKIKVLEKIGKVRTDLESTGIKKNKVNTVFGKNVKYADLHAINEAITPLAAKHGLSISQAPIEPIMLGGKEFVRCQTVITSNDGGYYEVVTSFPAWKEGKKVADDVPPMNYSNIHSHGAGHTFAKRYALCGIFNIVADDDDDGASMVDKETKADGESSLEEGRPEQQNKPSDYPAPDLSQGLREFAVVDGKRNPYSGNTGGDWRDITVHFGKNKGCRLGDLKEGSLKWLYENWVPAPYNNNPPRDQDWKLDWAIVRWMNEKSAQASQTLDDDFHNQSPF